MLSRSILRPSYTRICYRATRTPSQKTSRRPFSQLRPRLEQQASSTQKTSESSTNRNGNEQQSQRGSVRPFTVLFLCIPLGYGINWALKKQNVTGQVSPDGFVKYMLASKEDVSSDCSIFTLLPSSPIAAIGTNVPELARSITSVQFKQPQLQIARSYTLLPHVEGQDDDELRFLIKREQKGEVSGYLHRLPLDAEVEVRGASKEYVVPEGVKKVVFLAGGTGIAPAMQIADILKHEKANMRIMWANRKREDCAGGTSDIQGGASSGSSWSLSRLWSIKTSEAAEVPPVPMQPKHQIVQELDKSKESNDMSAQKLRVDYFVDEEGTFIRPSDVSRLLQEPSPGKNLLIVSGPEGFVNYWAGPKQWLDGREVQGPIAGALGSMNTTGWEVVKL